jgi:hypothetical protein
VQRLPNEVAERDDKLRGLDIASGNELARGVRGETHVLFGTEQNDVRKRRLDRVANPPRTVVILYLASAFQIALVLWVDFKAARERAAQSLVGGDERAQSLVDLSVLAVAPLLHRLHDDQANRDANERDDRDADETEEHRLPGTEVEITHGLTFILSHRALQSQPLSRAVTVLPVVTSVMPHMHWLGKDFTFAAVLPDGKTRIPFIKIDHWNFNWQGIYAFKEPIRVPKGSWFEVQAHFDNSESNPANLRYKA